LHFGNSTIFGISGKVSRKVSVPFASVSVLVEWKAPKLGLVCRPLGAGMYRKAGYSASSGLERRWIGAQGGERRRGH